MTGSWCFTEILILLKPCSSKSDASQRADSASASGVAFPYLASNRGSSEPALTPILMGMPASPAAFATSLTLSSNCLIFPGFTQIAELTASGCQIVRVAVPSQDDADALAQIAIESPRTIQSIITQLFVRTNPFQHRMPDKHSPRAFGRRV